MAGPVAGIAPVAEAPAAEPLRLAEIIRQPAIYVPAAMILIAIVALYRSTMGWWWWQWTRPGEENYYSHGVFVPFLIVAMIWLRRDYWRRCRVEPNPRAIALIVPALALWYVSRGAHSAFFSSMSLVLLVTGGVWWLLGNRALRIAIFPILYSFFMIPMPMWMLSEATFPPQIISATLGGALLRTFGFHVEQVGTSLYLDNYSLEVVVACSGFKLLLTVLTATTFLVFLVDAPQWKKALLLAASIPVAVLCNVLRVALIGSCGELISAGVADKVHDFSGYVILVLAMAAMAGLMKVFRCRVWRRDLQL